MAMATSATCARTVMWFILVVILIFVLMKYFASFVNTRLPLNLNEEEHLTLIQVNMVPN
jgi:hypothetical protein